MSPVAGAPTGGGWIAVAPSDHVDAGARRRLDPAAPSAQAFVALGLVKAPRRRGTAFRREPSAADAADLATIAAAMRHG